jgi:transketolase
MKFIVSRSLILLACVINFNAMANKQCSVCQDKSTENKDTVHKNALEASVLQAIKAEFQTSNIDFNIPAKMNREFETKRQFVINSLNQKMTKLNIDYVGKNDISLLVQKTFNLLIKRIEYCQIANWTKEILANAKNKAGTGAKRSCLNVDASLRAKAAHPPYCK